MAHIVVTGGCGFLGTWIIRNLLAGGHRVSVLDLERVTKRWELVLSPAQIECIQFMPGRIDEPQQVKDIFSQLIPDGVIHLAGLQVPTCRSDPLLGARVNVLGTLAIFEAAQQLARRPPIVYASSAAVFGSDADYDGKQVNDQSHPLPGTHYGAFKLCGEHCAKVYFKEKGLCSTGLRPLTVYGPGRDVGMTSFPSRAMAAALLGKPLDIPFRGRTTYTFVDEVAQLFVAAVLRPAVGAPCFTVGGDVLDVPQFIRELERVVPGACELITCSGGDLPIASNLNDQELRAAYPEVARVGIDAGIQRTVEIFKRLAGEHRLEV